MVVAIRCRGAGSRDRIDKLRINIHVAHLVGEEGVLLIQTYIRVLHLGIVGAAGVENYRSFYLIVVGTS